MSRLKLTDRWISSCPLPTLGRHEHSDAVCPWLYLRVTSAGVKSFSVLVRQRRLIRRTLGRYPVLALADARRAAMQMIRDIAEAGAQDAEADGQQVAALTLAALAERHLDLHLKRNIRSWRNVQSMLGQPALGHLHSREAAGIEKREIIAVLDGLVAAGKPHAAVNLLKNLKAMFNWGVDRDLVPANPCDRLRPPVKTTERERVLTDAEIVAVINACDKVPAPFGAIVRMLLYTGARRNEIAMMKATELDGAVWTLPATRSKSKRPNSLPLPPQAMAVIAAQPSLKPDGYVFSTTGGKSPSSDFSKRKRLLDAASGVSNWHLHDLRRTARSKLSQLGVPREVARRIVGHAADKLDSIYDRHSFVGEKAAGLLMLAQHLDGLVAAAYNVAIK